MSDVRMGFMLNWSTANCYLVGNFTVGNKHANLSVKLLVKVQQAHFFSADLSLTFGLVQKVPTDCTLGPNVSCNLFVLAPNILLLRRAECITTGEYSNGNLFMSLPRSTV